MKAVAGKRIVIILVNFFLVLFYFCCGENTTENSTPERVFRFDKFNNGDRYEYEYVSSYYPRSEMDFFYRTTGTAVLFIDSIIATKDTIWFSVNYNLISPNLSLRKISTDRH
ncbi:MAG: hypothetical protein KKH32_13125 [Bacteroidetes bacterium]|nr:hypothetical protein [Bacteroidota bacterium]